MSSISGVGVMFAYAHEGSPSMTYFRMRVYGSRVGISDVSIKGPAVGATAGNWVASVIFCSCFSVLECFLLCGRGRRCARMFVWLRAWMCFFVYSPKEVILMTSSLQVSLQRFWEGTFNWTSRGDIGGSFEVRITSIFNETLVYPSMITAADLQANKKFPFNMQFSLPTGMCCVCFCKVLWRSDKHEALVYPSMIITVDLQPKNFHSMLVSGGSLMHLRSCN